MFRKRVMNTPHKARNVRKICKMPYISYKSAGLTNNVPCKAVNSAAFYQPPDVGTP